VKSIIESALDAARLAGATYADARIVDTLHEGITVASGRVEGVESSASFGVGVRVIADGSWGFSATHDVTEKAAAECAARAVAIARASGRIPHAAVALSDVAPVTDTWRGPGQIDPFSVPLEEKLDLLVATDEAMRAASEFVKVTKASLGFYKVHKVFGSSLGSYIEQDWIESGAGITAFALGEDEVLPRSYPNSHTGSWMQAGWEFVTALDLVANGPRIAQEAEALLSAPFVEPGKTDLIIDGSQVALQVHESIGHPTELDRVLGDEAAFAGTSFLTLSDVGSLKYGSEIVNVTADATQPGSLGSFGYDDEGVPAQRTYLVRDGLFEGFLSSRESAVVLDATSNGCMRADGWNRTPLIRMTTISLEPGTWSLPDLIADTDDGLYIETNNSWSIDDKRLNFQFACEIGWKIENGEFTGLVKSPNYTGITPEFWNSCDAVCSPEFWRMWGLPNCGKGEPMQTAHVAHGAAPARFRGVSVGVGR